MPRKIWEDGGRSLPLGFALLYQPSEDSDKANLSVHLSDDASVLILIATKSLAFGDELTLAPSAFDWLAYQPPLDGTNRGVPIPSPLLYAGATSGEVRSGVSTIHGRGVFATRPFKAGECIEI